MAWGYYNLIQGYCLKGVGHLFWGFLKLCSLVEIDLRLESF
jgi:hypothetical protein